MQDIQTGRRLPAPSRAEREIAKSSRGHCTAHNVLGDGPGRRMQAESHLELTHLLLLDPEPYAVLGDRLLGEAKTRLLIPAWDADQ